MNTTMEQSTKLRVNRLIKAPRERVFTAWTNYIGVLVSKPIFEEQAGYI